MMIRVSLVVATAMALVACGEKPQTAAGRKSDEKAWANASSTYAAPGFKAGDAGTWETQIRARNQAQNEYARTATR